MLVARISSVSFFRLRLLHEMQTIVTNVRFVCLSVRLSVCLNAPSDTDLASLCEVIVGNTCSVRRVPCARGHLMQPLPKVFGLLFTFTS